MAGETMMVPEKWTAYYMVNETDGKPLTADETGEYIRNAVTKTMVETGGAGILAVSVKEDGISRNVCLIGNGPKGPRNARMIEQLPQMHASLTAILDAYRKMREQGCREDYTDEQWRAIFTDDEWPLIGALEAALKGMA